MSKSPWQRLQEDFDRMIAEIIEDSLYYGAVDFEAFTLHGTHTTRLRYESEPEPKPEPRKEAPVSNDEGFSYKRLIDLLGMTTSQNDNEAIVAMKMANKELKKLGKTWHEFIMSKVVVVADPFDRVPEPPRRSNVADEHARRQQGYSGPADWSGATAPTRPAPPPPPRPQYRPQRPYTPPVEDFGYMAAPSRPKPRANPDPFRQTSGRPATASQPSRISNRFAGLCVKCKERVGPGEGEAFLNGKFSDGKDRWCVEHTQGTCPVKAKPAPVRGSWTDLDNMIS